MPRVMRGSPTAVLRPQTAPTAIATREPQRTILTCRTLFDELAHAGLIEAWVSPAILEEYAECSATIQNLLLKSSRASRCAIR